MSYEINILCVGQTAPIDCRPAGFELKNEVEALLHAIKQEG